MRALDKPPKPGRLAPHRAKLPPVRSRPTLEVRYSPRHPRPGQRVRFEAIVTGRTRTPIDGVAFRFTGSERRQQTHGKGPAFVGHTWFDLQTETGRGVLEAGETVVHVADFALPPGLPPGFTSAVSCIEYVLEARVDIPWWPDRTERYRVDVRPAPAPAPKRAAAFVSTGPRGKGVHLELSVAGAGRTLGGALRGAVSAENFGSRAVRRLEVAVVVVDSAIGRSEVGPCELFRSEPLVVSPGAPEPGTSYPFAVGLPTQVAPSFKGRRVQVRWYLEARAVVRLGRDVVLRSELEVTRPVKGAKGAAVEAEGPPARIAPLGRERRALVWASVARHTGLTSDAEGETMAGAVGPIRLTVMLEDRGGRLSPVALLDWPALGLGLELAERRWRDALGGATPLADQAFDRRFAARGRNAAQLRALLNPQVRAQLSGFDRLALDDEGAELGSAETRITVSALEPFVRAALKTAEVLSAAFEGVPPPGELGAHRAAWSAFAQKVGGRFQPGAFAIRGAQHRGAPVELVTRFDASGVPEATWARALLGEPKAATAAAERVMASLARECDGLRLTDDAVEARLPCPLADPSRAESLWRALARVVQALDQSGSKPEGMSRL